MLGVGSVIQQRYQVVQQIGQGGMGAVYEAIDQRLGVRVALKQMLVAGSQFSRAFEREARILAGLRHPGLPRVMDHFVDHSGQYLVMEYIPGPDLGDLLQQRAAPFAPQEVLGWAEQLLRVLDYLHRLQPPVLHRDIKPQNIKFTPSGELVLLDFGLAKGSTGLTQGMGHSQTMLGFTPTYAPLEQVQGSGTDQRSDVYGCGATLYRLLTGHAPPDALGRASALALGQPDPLLAPSRVNPAVPSSLDGPLLQALALHADQRRRPGDLPAH